MAQKKSLRNHMNNLNLARKLRPKTFAEIIGQDLSVSMLKNSLFLKKLFPVYLFSGQRGCGKTSTARVFAAAINCQKLPDFQTDAKNNPIPCLTCESCKAMLKSHHPDFIEMDAASHTGVDSIRQIIESCTYIPLTGSKKIYLIDEAHMLSRAAFNAFLKILEEPPISTIFVLATTEIQKIPDTVRSRCFQVIFNPVQNNILFNHLQNICSTEQINADEDALQILIQENDGSVRDAINTLEQVRFTGKQITKELILASLGKISETQLYTMFEIIFDQNPQALITYLQEIKFETLSAQNLWIMLIQFLRKLLLTKYGVTQSLKTLADKCTINKLHALLQIMWSQESHFLQTQHKHLFFETILLAMCRQVTIADLQHLIEQCKDQKTHPNPPPPTNTTHTQPWTLFIKKLEQTTNDPLLISIFKQANFISAQGAEIKIQLASNGQFLKEKINETENTWKSILTKYFSNFTSFTILECKTQPNPTQKFTPRTSKLPIDISDTEKWPKANLLTKVFSGRLEGVLEKKNGRLPTKASPGKTGKE